MDISILACFFYGLFAGLTEFLPVSAPAHQFLYTYLTEFSGRIPFIELMVCIGSLSAVVVCCWKRLVHIRRELYLVSLPKKRRKRLPDMQAVADFRLMLIGLIPMFIGILFYSKSQQIFGNLPLVCLMLILTGVFLYLPQYLGIGHKDSRGMNRLEGLLLGACNAIGVIPGISRIGFFLYAGRARHCGRVYCMDLVLLYSIPFLLGLLLFQVIALIAGTAVFTTGVIIGGILAALAAFGGGIAGISLMRFMAVKLDFHGFAYYCWGLAVFCFIYYLIT